MKYVTGKVISNKMKETAVVEINWSVPHPVYQKRMQRSSKFHAHNALGAKIGDMVRMVEIKPMSKTKNWKIEEVISSEVAVKAAK